MKKVLAAVIACVFVFSMAVTAFAADVPSPPPPPLYPPETDTTKPSDADSIIEPATNPSDSGSSSGSGSSGSGSGTGSGTGSKPTTTRKSDVDDTTKPGSANTTKRPVTSDRAPVSPDTGSYVSKTVSAAALVAIALSGAVIYTTKKKAE